MQYITSIPRVFRGILIAFLILLMLRITYPIANTILNLFQAGIMKVAATLAYWLIILFVTWFLLWIFVFQPSKQPQGGNA